jgi:hypothetical protein
MPNHNKPKVETITEITQLVAPPERETGTIEGSVPITVDTHQQHPVEEYTEGYGLIVVREIPTEFSSGKILCVTDHFILTGMNESDQERFSMAYTIGDPVLRGGRGRRPRMYAYTGVLVDTEEDGSGISLWRVIYEKYLRASSTVNLKAIIEFTYRDQYRKGYITGCRLNYNANQPQRAGLMWTMFVIGADRAKS